MTPLLRLNGACAGYGQSQVLWNVDLDIPAGGVTAVIGRNGVGKTTLLRTIVGAQPLTGGKMLFDGWDVSRQPSHQRARAGIGYVPQGRHVFPHLTVEENLATGLSAAGGRGDGKVPGYVFEMFPKLDQIRQRKAGVLSGGEQQQLAIGRALAGMPRLLLLDEPTEGIQPNVVQQIEEALQRVRQELGVTIVIVEQYLDFAWSFADRYCVIQRGRVIREGSTRDERAEDVAGLVSI
ncbi:MAG: urea ABC transporter ATP-binding subunit UrtE [Pseudomonadota bacterium]